MSLSRRSSLGLVASGAALALGCTAPARPAGLRAQTVRAITTSRGPLQLSRVAGDLENPWSLAFLPGGDMLVTERPGRVRRIMASGRPGGPISGVPQVQARGQGGLLEILLHPGFAQNGLLYLSSSAPSSGGASTHVTRARLEGDRLVEATRIYVAEPGSETGRHFGSRMAFDAGGRLFVTTGDRGEMDRAQDLRDLAGKIVRLNDDGSVPSDNPFVGRSDARPEIYAYGVRNPQGLAVHPQTGELWEQEHGPRGGDEVNIIRPGRNYGWPIITHGIDYSGAPIGVGKARSGLEQPIWTWVPSIAPSGMAFYTSDIIQGWRGSLLVGALKDELLVRLELDGARVVREERLLEGTIGRIRDVRQGPDGSVYLLTDERDGGLYRLGPLPG